MWKLKVVELAGGKLVLSACCEYTHKYFDATDIISAWEFVSSKNAEINRLKFKKERLKALLLATIQELETSGGDAKEVFRKHNCLKK